MTPHLALVLSLQESPLPLPHINISSTPLASWPPTSLWRAWKCWSTCCTAIEWQAGVQWTAAVEAALYWRRAPSAPAVECPRRLARAEGPAVPTPTRLPFPAVSTCPCCWALMWSTLWQAFFDKDDLQQQRTIRMERRIRRASRVKVARTTQCLPLQQRLASKWWRLMTK